MSDIEQIKRRLERERAARKAAETIAEEKTREIYEANVQLQHLNSRLEELVRERTTELAAARDEAVRASQAKSDFLASMSHELRTPLNAIIGYSEMLLEEADELVRPELKPDLEKIRGAGKHLLGLINDILDLSKIEAGKMDVFPETFDVAGSARRRARHGRAADGQERQRLRGPAAVRTWGRCARTRPRCARSCSTC